MIFKKKKKKLGGLIRFHPVTPNRNRSGFASKIYKLNPISLHSYTVIWKLSTPQSSDFLLYNKHPSSTLNLPQITPLFPPQNQPRSHPNCNQFRPKPPTILCMQSVINLPRATSPHPSPPLFLFYLISLALRPFSVYFCVSSCTQFLPWHERVRQDNSFTKSLNRSSFHLSQQLIW